MNEDIARHPGLTFYADYQGWEIFLYLHQNREPDWLAVKDGIYQKFTETTWTEVSQHLSGQQAARSEVISALDWSKRSSRYFTVEFPLLRYIMRPPTVYDMILPAEMPVIGLGLRSGLLLQPEVYNRATRGPCYSLVKLRYVKSPHCAIEITSESTSTTDRLVEGETRGLEDVRQLLLTIDGSQYQGYLTLQDQTEQGILHIQSTSSLVTGTSLGISRAEWETVILANLMDMRSHPEELEQQEQNLGSSSLIHLPDFGTPHRNHKVTDILTLLRSNINPWPNEVRNGQFDVASCSAVFNVETDLVHWDVELTQERKDIDTGTGTLLLRVLPIKDHDSTYSSTFSQVVPRNPNRLGKLESIDKRVIDARQAVRLCGLGDPSLADSRLAGLVLSADDEGTPQWAARFQNLHSRWSRLVVIHGITGEKMFDVESTCPAW